MASSDIFQVHFENTLPLKGIKSVFSQAYIYVYLRNKETQQTLRVIVNIQYDASF